MSFIRRLCVSDSALFPPKIAPLVQRSLALFFMKSAAEGTLDLRGAPVTEQFFFFRSTFNLNEMK